MKERQNLCEVTQMMFDRFITNTAGRNITAKGSNEHWIMTPTLMSQVKFCRLEPDDILIIRRNKDGKKFTIMEFGFIPYAANINYRNYNWTFMD